MYKPFHITQEPRPSDRKAQPEARGGCGREGDGKSCQGPSVLSQEQSCSGTSLIAWLWTPHPWKHQPREKEWATKG